ncbi:hypothetical protein H271_10815 [Vibrio parahaemolyticus 1911C]|nr:hypothetical protein H271_10815 [Vibrio parahaemolyticus 1911C]
MLIGGDMMGAKLTVLFYSDVFILMSDGLAAFSTYTAQCLHFTKAWMFADGFHF